jgi:hypothetical protein
MGATREGAFVMPDVASNCVMSAVGPRPKPRPPALAAGLWGTTVAGVIQRPSTGDRRRAFDFYGLKVRGL